MGLESMSTTATSHIVEALSKHGSGQAVIQERQVIKEFRGPVLVTQHTYLLEGFIWEEIQKDRHTQILITVGPGW